MVRETYRPMTEQRPTTSFADRLNYLFETVHPAARKPYSNPEVATAITEAGVNISSAYLWLLRTGQRDNPTLRHIEALARFFGVPAAYFLDEEKAAVVAEQLELLAAARDADVREIMLRSNDLSGPDRATILRIMKGLAGDTTKEGRNPPVQDGHSDQDAGETGGSDLT